MDAPSPPAGYRVRLLPPIALGRTPFTCRSKLKLVPHARVISLPLSDESSISMPTVLPLTNTYVQTIASLTILFLDFEFPGVGMYSKPECAQSSDNRSASARRPTSRENSYNTTVLAIALRDCSPPQVNCRDNCSMN